MLGQVPARKMTTPKVTYFIWTSYLQPALWSWSVTLNSLQPPHMPHWSTLHIPDQPMSKPGRKKLVNNPTVFSVLGWCQFRLSWLSHRIFDTSQAAGDFWHDKSLRQPPKYHLAFSEAVKKGNSFIAQQKSARTVEHLHQNSVFVQ